MVSLRDDLTSNCDELGDWSSEGGIAVDSLLSYLSVVNTVRAVAAWADSGYETSD